MSYFDNLYTSQKIRKVSVLIFFITCMFSLSVNGNENPSINIGDVKVFAIDESLTYRNGEPANVIDTGVITDTAGTPVRGPHSIIFTLDENAAFPVIVKGNEVAPGESITLRENLSLVGSRLVLPVFPARAGIEGGASFTIDLPEIFTEACSDGFTETDNDCRAVEYEVLVIDCPAEYVANTESGIKCINYTTANITLLCEDGYTQLDNGMCNRQTVSEAKYNCDDYPGATLTNGMCVQQQTFTLSRCENGWDYLSGQCRRVSNTSPAALECPTGTWNGSKCERARSASPTTQTVCYKQGYEGHFSRDSVCTPYYTGSCPSGYNLQFHAGTCENSTGQTQPVSCEAGDSVQTFSWCRDESEAYQGQERYICNEGTYNSATGRCEWTDYYERQYSCPIGGTLSGSQCVTYEYKPYGNYCLSGGEYNASTGNCEIDINEPAGRHCNSPSVLEPDGVSCRLTEEYEFQYCDDSTYSPNDDYSMCERTLTEEPVLTCPDGYQVNESEVTCEKVVVTDFINS